MRCDDSSPESRSRTIEWISWSVLGVAVALAAVATTPASACTRCCERSPTGA